MTLAPRGSGPGYAIAFGGVLALVLLHGFAGWPASADVLLLLFLAVVTLAGWAGGFPAALAGTLLAAAVSAYFATPKGTFGIAEPAGQVRLTVLTLTGLLVALLARLAQQRGRLAAREAERVRASEERFRLAGEAVQGVLYDLDVRTGRFWASEGLLRLVGVAPDPAGFTHDWWHARIHPDDLAGLQAEIALVHADRAPTWSGRYRVRHEDGHWVHVWDSARLLRDDAGALVRVVGYSMDVTDQVRAAESLRASEERLRLATSVVRGLVYDVDFATGTAWRSEGLEALVGVRAEDAPPDLAWWHQRMHPEDWARITRDGIPYERTLSDNEYRVRHEDGHWVRVWDRMHVVRDAEGTPVRAIGFTMDTTELIEAREARLATEARLQLAMDGLGMAFWDHDLTTDELTLSESHFTLFGLAPRPVEETGLATWLDLVHPDDRARLTAALEASRDRGALFAATCRIRRPRDGEERILSAYGRHLRGPDGTPVRWVGVAMDVTEQERAREARRLEDERLRLAVEGAGMGTWEMDVATGAVRWSPSFFRMLGYEPSADGRADIGLHRAVLHPEDRERVLATLDDARRDGVLYAAEYRIQRADDGETRWISSYGRIQAGADGIERAIGVSFDVTARARAEEALRERAMELEQLLSVLPCAVWTAHNPEASLISGNPLANQLIPALDGGNVSPALPMEQRLWRRHLRNGVEVPIEDLPLQRACTYGEVAQGEEITLEFHDGRRLELLGGAAPLFGPDGRVRGGVAAFLDITARKRTEVELEEARRLFERIADTTPGILYLFDLVERRNVYANRGLEQVLGYRPEEVLAMGASLATRLLHPDDAALVEANDSPGYWAGDRAVREHELRMRHASGDYRVLRCRETVFARDEEGHPRLLLGIAHDVTDELATVEALRESEAQLRLSLQTARAMVFDWDIAGDRMQTFGAVPALDAVPAGLPIEHTLDTVEPADRDLVRARIAEALEGRTDEYVSEHRLRVAPGEPEAWVLVRGQIRRDEAGRPLEMTGVVVDTTARRRAEEAVRAAQEDLASTLALLDTLIEHAPVAMAYVDRELRYVRVNERAAAYAGLPREGILGRTVHEVSPDLVDILLPVYERALAGEALLGVEITGVASHVRTGEPPGTYLANFYPVRTDDGDVIGVGLIVSDITARKQAEDRLLASERRLRELADAMPQIVYVNRADGSLEYVNRQWEEYTGARFATDAEIHEKVHHDDRDRMLTAWEACRVLGEPYACEFRLRDRHGRYAWFLTRAVPVRDTTGRILRWYGTSTAIDEQKRAQAALAAGEARQRALADAALRINASLSVAKPLADTLQLVTDLARDIVGAHQALLMATRDGEGGQALHAISLTDKYARWRTYDEPVTGRGIYSVVGRTNRPMRLTQAELEAHPAFTRFAGARQEHPPLRGWLAVPLLGADGRNLGVLQFSDKADGGDFTAEDEAVAIQMAAMASVAMENWSLVEHIREGDRRKDEFLATLAHELRNPLAPISNSLELLRHATGDPTVLDRACATMDRQLGQMVRLIDDLLDASRISRGKLVLRREPLTLERVMAQAIETARPHLERARHALEVELPGEPVWLDGDGARLAQVFGNLLHNAAKYTPSGGRVTVRARCHAGVLEVRVADTGIGVPPAQLRLIFEMFAQVDRSLERSSGGLGIGLALVKGIVEMHGGHVEARSEGPGQGSEFVVTLPVGQPPVGATPVLAGAAPMLGRRRLLVADDNRDGADSMAALLRRSGHEVFVVYDGAEAVAEAARLQPHVVLLDLGMPRLNGHDAAAAIRRGPGGEEMVLVALTGWGDEATRRRTREAGFDGHLTKPVDYQMLLGLLDALTEMPGSSAVG